MGIIQRQAFFNTIINYAGVLIGFVNVVILFPLFLSQEEFGLTRLVLSLATTMAQLSSFGVHRIAVKFFPIFRNEPNKNNGLLSLLLIISSAGFIIITFIYLIFKSSILQFYSDDSALFSNYYSWIPLVTLGFLLFLVFESFLQALRKTVFTNLLRNVIIRIYWLIAILFYYYGFCTFFQFMLIYMLGYFLTAALCVIELIKSNEFVFDTNPNFYKKRILKPLLNYGTYSILSGVTLILVINVDLLMIGALLPENKLESVGIYAIATYIVSIIYIPNNALSRISAPIVAYDWKHKNLQNIADFYKKSSVILAFLGVVIFGCIALNINDLLTFMKPEFAKAKYIILILGFARLFDMASGLNLIILTVTRFYRAEAFLAILLLLLVVITNLIFIPIYGIYGAAIATAVVFLFFNVVVFIYIWKKLKMQPYSWATLLMLLFGFISAIIVYYIPFSFDNKIILIITKSILFSVLYFLPVYFLNISPDINLMVNKYFPFKIKRH
ncbi:MAG: oligosaccharide flippase family protein [Vicingaceae bacterium]|nr:oligosaccharide flippase family protein [Vicingaceae bacterium]